MPEPTQTDPWANTLPDPPPAPSGAGTLVWDVQAGRPAYVPVEQLDKALESGNYRAYGATQGVTSAHGNVIARTPADVPGALAAGERPVSLTADLARANADTRAQAFDTLADGVHAFVDGAVDMASMGLLHEHGDEADIRRDRHSLAHDIGGFAAVIATGGLGAEGSAARTVAKATPLGLAERGAGAIAKGLIPEAAAGSRAEVLVKGARGAISNAAIMAGYDVGRQASDALIEDKPFSAEHIANQIPAGLLLGGVLEGGSAALTRSVRREAAVSALAAQDGLVNPESALSKRVESHFDEAIHAWDQAVDRRAREIQILDGLQKDGQLVGAADLVGPRKAALDAALSARKALEKFDLPAIAAKGAGKDAARAAAALDAYGAAASRLEEVMAARTAELGNVARPAGLEVPQNPAAQFDREIGEQAAADSAKVDEARAARLDQTRVPSGEETIPGTGDRIGRAEAPGAGAVPPEEFAAFKAERERFAAKRGPHFEGADATEADLGEPDTGPQTARGPEEGRAAPDAATGNLRTPRAAEAEPVRDTDAMPARPEAPPPVAREVEGNRGRVVLEDGTEMWKSEHRKMLKDYLRSLDAYEREARGGLEGDLQRSIPTAEHGAVTAEMRPPGQRPTEPLPGREPRTSERAAPEPESPGQRPTREIPRRDTVVDQAAGALARADAAEAKAARSKAKADIKAAEKARREADAAMDRAQTQPMQAEDRVTGVHRETAPPSDVRVARSDRGAYEFFARLGRDGGPSPGTVAAAKVGAHLDALERLAQGRFTATKALEVAESLGVPGVPRGPLAEKYVQLWALRRLADGVVAEARGAGKGALSGHLAHKAQAYALGAAGFHVGGPIGAAIGASLGYSASLGSSIGKARRAIVAAAEKVLAGGRARAIARTVSWANYAPPEGYSYNGEAPTTDLRSRIEQIHMAAGDEDGTRMRIRKSMGDLAHVLPPEVSRAVEDTTIMRIRNLSISAPAYMWVGAREITPAAQEERRFRELETATWNPQMLLDAASRGAMTASLAKAMAMQHAEMQRVFTAELMRNPDAVKHMSPIALRQAELITGIPLTAGGDPAFVMRQQTMMTMNQQMPAQGGRGGGKPQALKITAPPPTPAQAQGASGRAPGN